MQLEIGECYDSINDALKGAIMAMGGFKKVAGRIRPDYANSDDWLRKCLHADARERLTPEQLMWILREARAVGFHACMDFMSMTIGYKSTPIDADAVKQSLRESIASSLESLNRRMATLERLERESA